VCAGGDRTTRISSRIAEWSRCDPLIQAEYLEQVLREHHYEWVKTVLEKVGVD